jgi:hypothetical protein
MDQICDVIEPSNRAERNGGIFRTAATIPDGPKTGLVFSSPPDVNFFSIASELLLFFVALLHLLPYSCNREG